MNLRIKLGQMICVGFIGTTPTQEVLDVIRTYKVGNISLFAHNFESKEQTKALVAELKKIIRDETGIDPIISVDQEGGMVTRFTQDFTHFPGAMAIAATGDNENAYRMALCTGAEMKAVGVNGNFAPVVDINTNSQNPVIGVRSYGDTAQAVNHYAMRMLDGLKDAGVLSMMKHFPGHGDTYQDSHFSLPRLDKTVDELMENELLPYIEGIRHGAPAIMTSHIVFPNIDPSGLPATMSRVIMHDLLREKLHFQGITRTDDLEMEAIRREFGIVKGAVGAISAGVDIVSISRSPALGGEVVQMLEQQIASGELDIEIIETAFQRIMACKERYCSDSAVDIDVVGCKEHRDLAKEISSHSVASYGDPRHQLPVKGSILVVGTHAFNQTNVRNPLQLGVNFAQQLGDRLNGQGFTVGVHPTEEEISQAVAMAKTVDTVIFGTYNAHLFTEQLELAQRLSEANNNVIFAAMRNPYDLPKLPQNCASLAVYEYTRLSIDTLGSILLGEQKPMGTICVNLGIDREVS